MLKTGGKLIAATAGKDHLKEMMEHIRQAHVDNIWTPFTNPFTLDNGLAQLRSIFPNVTVYRYEDNLVVTEVEPIMAYIRSSIRAADVAEGEFLKVQASLGKELEEKGNIFFQKDAGLFEAVK